eukprot:37143_1
MSSKPRKKKSRKRTSTKLKAPIINVSTYSLLIQNCKISERRCEIDELDFEVEILRKKSRNIMQRRALALQVYPRVANLKKLVIQQETMLEEERRVINKRKEALLSACEIIKNCIAYNKLSNKKVIDAIDSYHADRLHLQTYDRKLKLRQHKMCRQLLHIFPFRRIRNATEGNNNLYTTNYEIRTMSLPSRINQLLAIVNIGGQEEEKMAIGLGYIAHLCTLLSRYLQIPLRHPIICRGSRSEIIDAFAEAEAYVLMQRNQKRKSPKFPLYSKGTDRKLFKKGVELLQENICQLCISVGMDEFDQHAFIHNVRTVLYSQALARF